MHAHDTIRQRAMTIRSFASSLLRGDTTWSVLDAARDFVTSLSGLDSTDRLDSLVSTSGLARRATWMVPEDALAMGWRTDLTEEQDVTAGFDSDYAVEAKLLQAGGSARQHGGAWLWPVVDAAAGDWGKPIGEGPHAITALHVLSAREVVPLEWERDANNPRWMRPSVVRLQVTRDGQSYNVERMHASRLIYVPGTVCAPSQRSGRMTGYDVPILKLYEDAVCGYDAGGTSIRRLMERVAYFWVRLKGDGKALNTSDANAQVAESLSLLKTSMETAGLLALFGDDEAGWDGPRLTGLGEAMTALAERVSAVEGIPLTLLLGQAPGGLGTDGESGRRSYSALLGRWRRHVGTVALLELYDFALGPDATRRIEWPATDAPKDLEVAQASLARAQRDAVLVQAMAIDPDEIRTRFDGGEEQPLWQLGTEVPDDDGPITLDVPEPQGPQPPAGVDKAQDLALNGAQVTAAQGIVVAVAAGQLPRKTGVAMLETFFNIPNATAAALMGDVGQGFVPTPDEPTAEPPL